MSGIGKMRRRLSSKEREIEIEKAKVQEMGKERDKEMKRLDKEWEKEHLEICIDILNSIYWVKVLSPSYYFNATQLFQVEIWRNTFLAIPPEIIIYWLHGLNNEPSNM
uniref:Uncharacterized protein n=1 Tax=Nelumbo nucifera TaxID=4432 RepID=A0A822YDJ3_NELNU|nr:TPA_asm: hypothetical protein HUJ06_030513 [Nelumbo nucifera]